MEKIDDDFKSLFSQFKGCHSCISPLNQKLEREHPIQKLFEAFSLCSGAFYHLCLYYNNYPEEFKNSQKKNEENWNIFSKTQNYQAFCSNFFPPSEIIQLDFISMCIANAAFRLSAAGELVCDVIQKIDLNECEICDSKWPYQRFFNPDDRNRSWNRKLLHKKGKNWREILDNNILLRNLSLLVALRDEYGHSEFQEGHKERTEIRDLYYPKYIIDAELEMLRNCIYTICFLCTKHQEKLKSN